MVSPAPAADVKVGSFTDHGPRVLDLHDISSMPWRQGLDRLCTDVRRSLPVLIRPRQVPPGLRVITTLRLLGGGVALWALKERKLDRPAKIAGISRRVRVAAEHLGPTYI